MGDRVIELANEGFDIVYASASFALQAGDAVEVLRVAGSSAFEDIDLTGNAFGQEIIGNWGVNRLDGRDGDDTLFGQMGADVLIGGGGRDVLWGGSDADTFVYNAVSDSRVGGGRDQIRDWDAADAIDVSAIDADEALAGHQGFVFVGEGSVSRSVGAGELKYYHVNGNTYVVGDVTGDGEGDFQIEITGTHDLVAANFIGLGGLKLAGGPGGDVLSGSGGDDIIYGAGGRDVFDGGAGSDTFLYLSADESRPGGGRDLIRGWDSSDRIDVSAIDAATQTAGHQGFTYLGEGSTSRSVDAGGLKFYHVNGNTYIVGDVNGDGKADIQIEIAGTHDLTADNFIGLASADIVGTSGSETLNGTSGDDRLIGGGARDVLFGGGGDDVFVYTELNDSRPAGGRDFIADWDAGDKIDLSALDADTLQSGRQMLDFVGEGSVSRSVASGDLKYYHVNGNTYLVASVDGDTDADFQIEIAGVHVLTADDFLL